MHADRTEARDAVMSLFKTAWEAQPPPIPIVLYDDRKKEIPTNLKPYARIMMRHNTGAQTTLTGENNKKRFTNRGTITVQVFSEFGTGLVLNDQMATIATGAFEGQKTDPDGVWFLNVRAVEIGQSGDWFQTNVLADFRYDLLR